MPHMSEVLDSINPLPPRSLVRVSELIPEWIVGTVYKSGGFIFLLREMDTEGMTLEILETHLEDSEIVSAPTSKQNSAQRNSLLKDQNDKTNPIDPMSIVPRAG